MTSDGVVRPGLFKVQDEGVPIDDIISKRTEDDELAGSSLR